MSRLPETGPSLRRIIEQERRRVGRAENSSAFTRSGTSVTAENEVTVTGQMRSADYDGTSRTDLGSTGWMLGPDDGGPSLIALNGIDVYADLAAKDVLLAAQDATLAAQDVTILGLIAKVIEVDDFDHSETAFDPPGGAWYTASSVTLTTPAGFTQAVVTAVAYAAIYNTPPADTTVHSRVLIAGTDGPEVREGTTSGLGSLLSMFPKRVIGLTGGSTFVVACQTYCITDFTAHATNNARISGTVLWLR